MEHLVLKVAAGDTAMGSLRRGRDNSDADLEIKKGRACCFREPINPRRVC